MMSYDTENSTIAFIIFGPGETWTHPLLHHHFRSRLFLGCARPLLRWTMRMSRWAMKPWRFEDGSQKLAKLDDIVSFLKWRPQTIHFLGGIFRLSMMNHPCWGVPLSRSTQPMAVVGRPFFGRMMASESTECSDNPWSWIFQFWKHRILLWSKIPQSVPDPSRLWLTFHSSNLSSVLLFGSWCSRCTRRWRKFQK